jgi:hypothetical protein
VFYDMLATCQQIAPKKKFRFRNQLLSLDSTVIDLCASVFDWARFRTTKGAVKLHLLLDHDGYLPTFASITEGRVHDVKFAQGLKLPPGSIVAMDRGYYDFELFNRWTNEKVWFVSRLKTNADYYVVKENPVPDDGLILADEVIRFAGSTAEKKCPHLLRRIAVWVEEKAETIELLTNHHGLAAHTNAAIYKKRWQIGVSEEGHIVQSVKVRPRPIDSGLVAWEAPWRESKTVKPSDNMNRKEHAQHTRLQRAVNAEVASLHATPVAETVDNARRQQGPCERSLRRRSSPAGYQRWHGVKEYVSTGEALGTRRRNLAEEAHPITASGKWVGRCQGGGSGRSTEDGRGSKTRPEGRARTGGYSAFQGEAGVR